MAVVKHGKEVVIVSFAHKNSSDLMVIGSGGMWKWENFFFETPQII